ncbi:MAG TPA: hypothetical protein EYO33_07605 [Phycisphaerales bacterium]|nr:hypothetical protein [Phycisphaerales bacterium]
MRVGNDEAMLRFNCPNCDNELFFNSLSCLACGRFLEFSPRLLNFVELAQGEGCLNRRQHNVCNWEKDGEGDFCRACARNILIPDLTIEGNLEKWGQMEESKRRLFFSCFRLGIPMNDVGFRFVASTGNESASTGHLNGVITINLGEADPVSREITRTNLNEKMRTLIGHFRHEFGHYYWHYRIETNSHLLEEFRELYGDERADYQASLDTYYRSVKIKGQDHISVYASSHPWEDWAETFAHYLHFRDTLETAQTFGLTKEKEFLFEEALKDWIQLSVALNEVNRSLGLPDLYPFTLSPGVVKKLEFCHRVICGSPTG